MVVFVHRIERKEKVSLFALSLNLANAISVLAFQRAVALFSLLLCELFQFRFEPKLLSIGISTCRLLIKKTFFLFPEFASLIVAARKNIFLLLIELCPLQGVVENLTQFTPQLI